jgi:hypothetical protein
MRTVDSTQCMRAEHGLDHQGWQHAGHKLPGERERIAFHFHQFSHGCFGNHCPASNRLYVAWQAAILESV